MLKHGAVDILKADGKNCYKIELAYTPPYISEAEYDYLVHTLYQGICPFGHDQAFYLDTSRDILNKATFKGTNPVKIEEIDWPHSGKVTLLKSMKTNLLAIGTLNGSI
jgi:hypothetical protein